MYDDPRHLRVGTRRVMAARSHSRRSRLVFTLVAMVAEFRGTLRPDFLVLRRQLAYALPFAIAVGIEVLHINWHQYAVARDSMRVVCDLCGGLPAGAVVDLIVGSTCNVMMVEMAACRAATTAPPLAVARNHRRLAFMIFPAAAFLIVMAREIIVLLFTTRYEASVPIFMLWSLTMLASVFLLMACFAPSRRQVSAGAERASPGDRGESRWNVSDDLRLQGAVLITLFATLVVRSVAVCGSAIDADPFERGAPVALAGDSRGVRHRRHHSNISQSRAPRHCRRSWCCRLPDSRTRRPTARSSTAFIGRRINSYVRHSRNRAVTGQPSTNRKSATCVT
jgi:hypothetical protein